MNSGAHWRLFDDTDDYSHCLSACRLRCTVLFYNTMIRQIVMHFTWLRSISRTEMGALTVTDILSRTGSELSQLSVQILDILLFWATFCGLGDNVRCSFLAPWKARSGLPVSVNWTFWPWHCPLTLILMTHTHTNTYKYARCRYNIHSPARLTRRLKITGKWTKTIAIPVKIWKYWRRFGKTVPNRHTAL